ncbi:MAG: hypothetical protein JO264_04180 [Acidisphaera sp.]|nr:hypothetical protein [Acidisphaera sp.]
MNIHPTTIRIEELSEPELVALNHRIIARLRFLQRARVQADLRQLRIGGRAVLDPPEPAWTEPLPARPSLPPRRTPTVEPEVLLLERPPASRKPLGNRPAIDDPDQVGRLIEELSDHLPFAAGVTPQLAEMIRRRAPGTPIPRHCQVTWVHYGGDEAGIVCKLDLTEQGGAEDRGRQFYAPITQLLIRRGTLLARDIAAYQKHRLKRLRRGRW